MPERLLSPVREVYSAVQGHSLYPKIKISPVQVSPGAEYLGKFIIEARRLKDLSKSPLTEADIEKILNKVTGKDHKDFFEFYKSEGFSIDPADITNFLKTFSYRSEYCDNAVKSTPHSVGLGKTAYLSHQGGFIGTRKVFFQDVMILQFK